MSFMEKKGPKPEAKYARKQREIAQGIREPFEFKEKESVAKPTQRVVAPQDLKAPRRLTGKIVHLNALRNYAFVETAHKRTYFVHLRELEAAVAEKIVEGAEIEFSTRASHSGKRPQAIQVSILSLPG